MASTHSLAAALLGVGTALLCGQPSALSQSGQLIPKEIHVDRSCGILPEESNALADFTIDDLRSDHSICHLESVLSSQHLEETDADGVHQLNLVQVQEQEYLLQNVTSTPVMFVVEHVLPEGWAIDSDPPPVKVEDSKAYFRSFVLSGETVRLHVGERHIQPVYGTE